MPSFQEFDRMKAAMEPLEAWFSGAGLERLLTALCAHLPLDPQILPPLVAIVVRWARHQEAEMQQRWEALTTMMEHLENIELRLKELGVDHLLLRCAAADVKACAMWWQAWEYARVCETHCPHCGAQRDPSAPRRTLSQDDFPERR